MTQHCALSKYKTTFHQIPGPIDLTLIQYFLPQRSRKKNPDEHGRRFQSRTVNFLFDDDID